MHMPSNVNVPTISIGASKIKPTAAIIIPIWIILSSSVIIYNNYVYNTLGFKYPVFLVSWHMVFSVSNHGLKNRVYRFISPRLTPV